MSLFTAFQLCLNAQVLQLPPPHPIPLSPCICIWDTGSGPRSLQFQFRRVIQPDMRHRDHTCYQIAWSDLYNRWCIVSSWRRPIAASITKMISGPWKCVQPSNFCREITSVCQNRTDAIPAATLLRIPLSLPIRPEGSKLKWIDRIDPSLMQMTNCSLGWMKIPEDREREFLMLIGNGNGTWRGKSSMICSDNSPYSNEPPSVWDIVGC